MPGHDLRPCIKGCQQGRALGPELGQWTGCWGMGCWAGHRAWTPLETSKWHGTLQSSARRVPSPLALRLCSGHCWFKAEQPPCSQLLQMPSGWYFGSGRPPGDSWGCPVVSVNSKPMMMPQTAVVRGPQGKKSRWPLPPTGLSLSWSPPKSEGAALQGKPGPRPLLPHTPTQASRQWSGLSQANPSCSGSPHFQVQRALRRPRVPRTCSRGAGEQGLSSRCCDNKSNCCHHSHHIQGRRVSCTHPSEPWCWHHAAPISQAGSFSSWGSVLASLCWT